MDAVATACDACRAVAERDGLDEGLQHACRSVHDEAGDCVRALIRAGADICTRIPDHTLIRGDDYAYTLADIANTVQAFEALLEHHAFDLSLAWTSAAVRYDVDIMRFLLSRGVSVNTTHLGKTVTDRAPLTYEYNGQTAIQVYVQQEYDVRKIECVKLLLEQGDIVLRNVMRNRSTDLETLLLVTDALLKRQSARAVVREFGLIYPKEVVVFFCVVRCAEHESADFTLLDLYGAFGISDVETLLGTVMVDTLYIWNTAVAEAAVTLCLRHGVSRRYYLEAISQGKHSLRHENIPIFEKGHARALLSLLKRGATIDQCEPRRYRDVITLLCCGALPALSDTTLRSLATAEMEAEMAAVKAMPPLYRLVEIPDSRSLAAATAATCTNLITRVRQAILVHDVACLLVGAGDRAFGWLHIVVNVCRCCVPPDVVLTVADQEACVLRAFTLQRDTATAAESVTLWSLRRRRELTRLVLGDAWSDVSVYLPENE